MEKRLHFLNQEQVVSITIALFFLIFLVGSFQFHPTSRLFPSIVSSVGLVVSLLHIFKSKNERSAPVEDELGVHGEDDVTAGQVFRGILLVVVSTISFILLGFWITSVALILLVPGIMGWRPKLRTLIALAVVVTGSVALLFNVLLKSPMPDGMMIEWIDQTFFLQD